MEIYDITVTITAALPVWPGDPSVELRTDVHESQENPVAVTHLAMSAHTGTHVDAPRHFIPGAATIERLDLHSLCGPALVVEAFDADVITAQVLGRLPIPPGTERLLLHTRNSDIWARSEPHFVEDFVGIDGSGAEWLVKRGVRLVGMDYLSVSPFHQSVPTHRALLGAGAVPLEGINLTGVPAGEYMLFCLPLKLAGSDGAPARTILVKE